MVKSNFLLIFKYNVNGIDINDYNSFVNIICSQLNNNVII